MSVESSDIGLLADPQSLPSRWLREVLETEGLSDESKLLAACVATKMDEHGQAEVDDEEIARLMRETARALLAIIEAVESEEDA